MECRGWSAVTWAGEVLRGAVFLSHLAAQQATVCTRDAGAGDKDGTHARPPARVPVDVLHAAQWRVSAPLSVLAAAAAAALAMTTIEIGYACRRPSTTSSSHVSLP